MGQDDDGELHYPSPHEYLITGIFGILIYLWIAYLSISSIQYGIRSKSTKRFFLCMIFLAILEIPRFIVMAIEQSYNSSIAYSLHLFAGIFFFVAFSIVCRQWSGLLQLGSYFRAVYGVQGLILSNISFAIVDIVAIITCLVTNSLHHFFRSTEFIVITFLEGIRNVVYSTFLSYYGVKLVRRFWHFSVIERRAAVHKSIFMYICACCSSDSFLRSSSTKSSSRRRGSSSRLQQLAGQEDVDDYDDDDTGLSSMENHTTGGPPISAEAVFTKVVLRMTSVLVLSSLCFMLRVIMLMLKMIALHSNAVTLSSYEVPIFGFLWFTFSDFLPRALPCLAFILLMRTKRPAQQMRERVQHKQLPGRDDLQFVPLAGLDDSMDTADGGTVEPSSGMIEDPFTLSTNDYETGIVAKSEVMLKADYLSNNHAERSTGASKLFQYEHPARVFAHQELDENENLEDQLDELYEYNPHHHQIPVASGDGNGVGRSRSSSRSSRNRTPVDFGSNEAIAPEEPHSFEDTVVDNILSFVTFGKATTETIGNNALTKQRRSNDAVPTRTLSNEQQQVIQPLHHSNNAGLMSNKSSGGNHHGANIFGRLKSSWHGSSTNSSGHTYSQQMTKSLAGDIEASTLQDNNYSI